MEDQEEKKQNNRKLDEERNPDTERNASTTEKEFDPNKKDSIKKTKRD